MLYVIAACPSGTLAAFLRSGKNRRRCSAKPDRSAEPICRLWPGTRLELQPALTAEFAQLAFFAVDVAIEESHRFRVWQTAIFDATV